MKNFVQRGDNLSFLNSQLVGPNALVQSGDPVVVGRIAGVANGTALLSSDTVVVTLRGVFNLSCHSSHNGLSVGETVFIDPVTGVLSDDLTAVPFGVALGIIAAAATGIIPVRLFGATPGATGAGS